MLPTQFNLRMLRACKILREIAGARVDQKIASLEGKLNEEHLDSASYLLDSAVRSQKLGREDLKDQALMLHSAAFSSAVVAILSAIYFLAQEHNQPIQEPLRKEIRTHVPPPSQGTAAKPETFDKMPYLEAVCNEVHRLHTVFSWTGRVSIETTTLLGTLIPKGTYVSLSPWALHRSRKLRGDDAEEFKPERWLDGGSTVPPGRCSYVPFGAGPRACIGEKFAKDELNCILSALFGRYKLTFDNETVPKVTHQVTMRFRDPLRVKIEILEGW